MTKTGGKKHLKRHASPRHWPIQRKSQKFIVKPRAGPHPQQQSIPLLVLIREMLGNVSNRSEAVRLLSAREVVVDGTVRLSPKHGVGYMDVVSFPKIDKHYRIVYTHAGLRPIEISSKEGAYKLCMIRNKTKVRGGVLQLNLHDGRNILVSEDKYKTKQTLRISVPEQKIDETFELSKGAHVQVIAGRHMGKIGVLQEYVERYGPKASTALVQTEDGTEVQTALDYVFVVGKKSPVVTLVAEGET